MNRRPIAIFVISAFLIIAAGGYVSYSKTHQRLGTPGVRVVAVPIFSDKGEVAGTNSVYLPERVLNFDSVVQPVDTKTLEWLPRDTTYGQRIYKSEDGQSISATVVLMGADRTSIHKPEYCLVGSGWRIQQQEFDQIPIPELNMDLPVRKFSITREVKLPNGQIALANGYFVFWFVDKDRVTADHNKRMLSMGLDVIRTGVISRWAYICCLMVSPPGKEEETYRNLREFIAAAAPQIHDTRAANASLARTK